MMAMWCLICGLFAGQVHAKAMDNEISDSDQGASFAPIILTDQSDGDQEPGRIGWTLLIIVISFMFCIYSSPISYSTLLVFDSSIHGLCHSFTLLQVCACWVSIFILIFFIFKSGELGAKSRSKQD